MSIPFDMDPDDCHGEGHNDIQFSDSDSNFAFEAGDGSMSVADEHLHEFNPELSSAQLDAKVVPEDRGNDVLSNDVLSNHGLGEDGSAKTTNPLCTGREVQKVMKKQLREVLKKRQVASPIDAKPAESSRVPIDEHAWMNEQPDDEEDDTRLVETFHRSKEQYERSSANGTLTRVEELAFKQAERAFNKRQERAEEEMMQDSDPNSLFIPEDEDGDTIEAFAHAQNQQTPSQPKSNSSRKRKATQQDGSAVNHNNCEERLAEALTAHLSEGTTSTQDAVLETAEDVEPDPEVELTSARPSKRRTKVAQTDGTEPKKKGRPKGKGKSKDKANEKAAAAPQPKKQTKKEIEEARKANNISNFSNLLSTDVFRDVETNRGFDDLPSFSSTRKAQAMSQLLASLPVEHREIAKTDKNQILQATKSFGQLLCRPGTNGQWKISGLKSQLSHYQMLGTAFMRDREKQNEEPRGGILADAMGLGKTVCMIANIVNGNANRRIAGPTLLVAAPSVLLQWKGELLKHAEIRCLGEIVQFTRKLPYNYSDPLVALSGFGVILATYGEVAKSLPKYNPPIQYTSAEEKQQWWSREYEEKRGWLHRIKFHRIVLDEAQAIKNPESQTSKACRSLEAVHRWAISGTPVQNTLAEFYPYFKFLRVPFTGNFNVFKKNFCSPGDPRGAERLNIILRQFMIRRTHNDTLLGAKLLHLPKPSKKTYTCHFSEIEKEIYNVVRTRFVLRINIFLKKGSLKRNYSSVLTMLLRLRQLTAHPLLIQDTLRDLLEPEDFEKLKKITEKQVPRYSSDAYILHHLREMLRTPKDLGQLEASNASIPSNMNDVNIVPQTDEDGENHQSSELVSEDADENAIENAGLTAKFMRAANDGVADSTELNSSKSSSKVETTPAIGLGVGSQTNIATPKTTKELAIGKAFGTKNSYQDYLVNLQDESLFINENEAETGCCYCDKEDPIKPHTTSCGHIYCYECLLKISHEAAQQNQDHANCVACGVQYTGAQKYSAVTAEQKERKASKGSAATEQAQSEEQAESNKKNSKPSHVRQIIDTWVDADGHMLPSAKTLAIKAQVMNWLQEDPTGKILIYSQFITMIHIVSKICNIEGWGYCQFTGATNVQSRAETIKKFETDPSLNIMVISLGCGGTGLNLTCASRVLIIDLWWNSAVEDQAFCRTYRRGQNKETDLTRLAVQDTVDIDILKMQERKDGEIGRIMGPHRTNKSVTIPDVLRLFGATGTDENGNEFLLVDDREHYATGPHNVVLDDLESIVTGVES